MTNEIDTLDQADREVVCGTLFHIVNWFREVNNNNFDCITSTLLGCIAILKKKKKIENKAATLYINPR